MKNFVLCIAIVTSFIWVADSRADLVIGFEDLNLASGSFYNGDSGIGTNTNGWSSGGVFFGNSYESTFGSWGGFSYSNVKNTTTAGFDNQYAAYAPASPGAGAGGSNNYAVAYPGSQTYFNLPSNTLLSSVAVTNSTYAALSMLNGDQYAKKFGGTSGNDPDFFRVSFNGFSGLNGTGSQIGSVTVNLADYTFANNSQDYLLSNWFDVDLSSLGAAKSVRLSFDSSDVGAFGINTPTYVALDNLTLTAVPEPSSLAMLAVVGSAFAWFRRRSKNSASR